MTTEVTLPDYRKVAESLYNVIVNFDTGHYIALGEIEHALKQAQRVGETLGYNKGFEDCRLKTIKEYL